MPGEWIRIAEARTGEGIQLVERMNSSDASFFWSQVHAMKMK
jgi:hypothetical protein